MRSVSDQGGQAPLSAEPGFAYCPGCGAPLGAPRPTRCVRCGRGHWRNAKPCGGALVVSDGRLLLVRRAKEPFRGWWDIPGGFCEATELPEEAAVREVREETGVHVEITGLVGMWMDRYDGDGEPQDTLNVYFLARPVGSPVVDPDAAEVGEAAWFTPEAIPERIAFPNHARAVLDEWMARLSTSAGSDATTSSEGG